MPPVSDLEQAWPRPSAPRKVVLIGAGGIVENAHLPAYGAIGIPVRGLFDLDGARAAAVAARFGVERIYGSLAEAVAEPGALFDVAVPARAVPSVIAALPEGCAVLIQKPMGETLAQARQIAALCEERQLTAAVNFQLRFSPNMLALAAAIRRGLLGELVDVEVRVNTYTPWQLWPFLKGLARHEILYHSIHYLDLIRSLLGEPRGVLCKVLRHPSLPDYADTRSATILDYGERCRVLVSVNHAHDYGPEHAMSELKLEGTEGAAVARMGVNLDYPRGLPDSLELAKRGGRFESVALRGSWFPCAFEGTISNLQRFVAGEDDELCTRTADALKTMALVEACYESSAAGGTRISDG
ncbi:MAG TPA: Gfo/Idh/MocA family oxidoreductase [Polyangiaceae bacterium]|jgi:predicted dehydrogenase